MTVLAMTMTTTMLNEIMMLTHPKKNYKGRDHSGTRKCEKNKNYLVTSRPFLWRSGFLLVVECSL